jgi:hypothetical protein
MDEPASPAGPAGQAVTAPSAMPSFVPPSAGPPDAPADAGPVRADGAAGDSLTPYQVAMARFAAPPEQAIRAWAKATGGPRLRGNIGTAVAEEFAQAVTGWHEKESGKPYGGKTITAKMVAGYVASLSGAE